MRGKQFVRWGSEQQTWWNEKVTMWEGMSSVSPARGDGQTTFLCDKANLGLSRYSDTSRSSYALSPQI